MRLRLLPILMFALAGTMTVKVGSVWDAFEVSVGTETLAQGEIRRSRRPRPKAKPSRLSQPVEQPAAPASPASRRRSSSPRQPRLPLRQRSCGQQAAATPEAPAGEQPKSERPMPRKMRRLQLQPMPRSSRKSTTRTTTPMKRSTSFSSSPSAARNWTCGPASWTSARP